MSNRPSSYRPEIDGFRSLAVIAVIINHFNPTALASGFLGVDIFFVLSGFVVTSSLANKRSDSSWQKYLLTFYSKRVKRLWPALVTCIIITSVIGCLVIQPTPLTPLTSLRTGMTALIGLSNLYLFKNNTDYFGEPAEFNLFTQTWSLGVETQFYLVFPIILGLAGFSGKRRYKGARNLFFTILSLSVISLLGYLQLSQVSISAAYFLTPTRFWELGAGCLTFLAINRFSKSSLEQYKIVISFLSTFLVIGVFFLSKDFQIFSTVTVVFLTCIVIWSFDSKSFLVTIFSSKWIVQIGLLSYSLYLWHWSVIVISRWTIGIYAWTIPFQLVLIIILALISYNCIEKPLRYIEWSPAKLKTIGYGLATSLICAVLLFILEKPLYGKLYTGKSFPESGMTSFKVSEDYQPCNNSESVSSNFAECSYPPVSSFSTLPKTIYFVGDSHNGALQALASRLIAEEVIPRIVMVEKKACFFSTSLLRETRNGEKMTECLEDNRSFLSKVIENGRKGDIVVLTNRYKPYFAAPNYKGDLTRWKQGDFSLLLNNSKLSQKEALSYYSNELVEISKRLSQKGISLVVQTPLPDWKNLPKECQKQWFNPSFLLPKDCELNFKSESESHSLILRKFQQAEAKSSNLYIFDPFPTFCNSEKCSPVLSNGKPLFRDSNHLNNYGAEYLYSDFAEFLKERSLL